MTEKGDRLKQARINAGYKRPQDAIDHFKWKGPGYRHHESGFRDFDVDAARRYGKAFKVSPSWLLGIDTVTPIPEPSREESFEWIEVVAVVQAGIWRERAEWAQDERYKIKVGPNPVPGTERFGLRLEGRSMDLTIAPGSDLECLRVAYGVVEPQDDDLVIVQRTAHDLTETTCKRLKKEGDEWVLYAESTLPEFDEPIRIGKPSEDHHDDNETRVVAIVLEAHKKLYRKR